MFLPHVSSHGDGSFVFEEVVYIAHCDQVEFDCVHPEKKKKKKSYKNSGVISVKGCQVGYN